MQNADIGDPLPPGPEVPTVGEMLRHQPHPCQQQLTHQCGVKVTSPLLHLHPMGCLQSVQLSHIPVSHKVFTLNNLIMPQTIFNLFDL